MIRRLLRQLQQRTSTHQKLDSQDAYAKWAENYPPIPHNLLMEIEQDTMSSLMPSLKDKHVLDLACGTGRYGLLAQSQMAQFVLGIDDSFAMLTQSTLISTLGSMSAIPLQSGSIDVVICGLAVGHYPQLEVVLSEISRVLIKGGEALISDFHPFQYLAGARRTFTQNNVVYEVEHYPHLYQTVHRAVVDNGLMIDAIQEPTIEAQDIPVVMVYRLKKP